MIQINEIYITQSNSSQQKYPNKISFVGLLGYKLPESNKR